MIIEETHLDNLLEENPDSVILHNLTSGCNINTGCYILLITALEECVHPDDETILNLAIKSLDSITESVFFNAFIFHYPIEDPSYATTIRLAKCLILIDRVTHGAEADNVPIPTVKAVELVILLNLNLRKDIGTFNE